MQENTRFVDAVTDCGKVISFVGAGGKTTLMYFLAATLAASGKKVLVSTTTHIYYPRSSEYAPDIQQVYNLWNQGNYAVIGAPEPDTGKLAAPDEDILQQLISRADIVLLESDGAKGYPCKMPREHEPVLHPETDCVIGVFGVSSIGKPLGEVCFGCKKAMELLGVGEDRILTAADATRLFAAGAVKCVENRRLLLVLNQYDTNADGAEQMKKYLEEMMLGKVLLTAFSPEEREKIRKRAKGWQ